MTVTINSIQAVLRSWTAIEVLTPQITKDERRNSNEDDLPPWSLLPDVTSPNDDSVEQAEVVGPRATAGGDESSKQRRWYSVILGAIPAKDAFIRLDATFQDQTEEDQTDRNITGQITAASVVLDESGVMVPDSLAIASFAWGLGHMLGGGTPDALSEWEKREPDIKALSANLLTPRGSSGQHCSLTWRDLRGVSRELAQMFGVPDDLWTLAPCAIEIMAVDPPAADILSSFFLPDLGRVLRNTESLPAAASSYLGLKSPISPWDALSDRQRLSALLDPVLFPLGRWPGPGLHPLSLLQQAAVNTIVRDLKHEGLAAVNGPPGTGKTTLLRDVVAHVMVTRAEKLAAIENPSHGLGDLDLMDFAIVVASGNNAAVENISFELPVRKKALDPSVWGGRFREARDSLFVAAVRLHHAFVVAGAHTLKPSLNAIAKAASGGSDAPKAQDWGVFFLLVPVVSTTFASIGRMFQTFGAASIGWVLIDEAGQAAPQQAVGAIWRARRAVVIGDPLQIEPVATTPNRTMNLIFQSNGIAAAPWIAPKDSAQTLADRASRIQGHFPIENGGPGEDMRVTGLPLLVHRRCDRPMFQLANRIAYADRMVFATSGGKSPIRDLLGDTAWIDIDAPSNDKWVEAEGQLIAQIVASLYASLPAAPDLYIISPFRTPALLLRKLLLETPGILTGRPHKERQDWIDKRVGTVHTFQGKEAEAVILMLGAGRGAKPGSRNWAGSTPNLLNVAATRAKRALYIVGNREEWRAAGVFSEAAHMLDVRPAQEWLKA